MIKKLKLLYRIPCLIIGVLAGFIAVTFFAIAQEEKFNIKGDIKDVLELLVSEISDMTSGQRQ